MCFMLTVLTDLSSSKISVQFSRSVVSDSVTPWTVARQASLSITNSRSLPKLMCIESVMPSSHLILCHPLLLVPPIPPPYMTTGKTIALTRRTFVGKVISLLLNILSRLVITFLPRSKHLLISWLKSPSAGILELKKIKSATVSTVSPSISHEVMVLHLYFISVHNTLLQFFEVFHLGFGMQRPPLLQSWPTI